MEANISFDRSPGVPHVRQDPFLIGVNSYIMVSVNMHLFSFVASC